MKGRKWKVPDSPHLPVIFREQTLPQQTSLQKLPTEHPAGGGRTPPRPAFSWLPLGQIRAVKARRSGTAHSPFPGPSRSRQDIYLLVCC